MVVSGRALIAFALGIVFYTAFKGAYYFLANRLQELGLLITFILFAYSALVASLNVKDKNLNWSTWIFFTLALVGYTFVLPGYQFSSHVGVSMLPSIMASREFLIVFIAPSLYFLYRIGFSAEKIIDIVMLVLALIVFSYIFHYFRIDLVAAYNSPDPTISGMTTHDEARGYRLKPPLVAVYMTSIIAAYKLVTSKETLSKLFWALAFFATLYVWYLVQARAPTAMLIIGVLFYHFWFARKPRLGLLFLSLCVIIPAYILAVEQYFAVMKTADDGVRYKAYMIAINTFMDYPFFGFGQQSAATVTEQEIFWYKFYSSDLGLIGIAFKYGAVGAFLYVFLLITALVKAVKTNWLFLQYRGHSNIFLVASIAKLSTDLFNTLLGVPYVYIEGLTHGAIIIALSAIYKIEFSQNRTDVKR